MAVYTDVSDAELQDFMAGYDLGEVTSFKGIAEGVENTNFLIETTRNRYILTIYEKRVDQKELPFFLNLMGHLALKGLNCPTPVLDKSGNNLNQLSGKPAALVTFLEGLSVRRPKIEHCAQLGRSMAEMHLAGRDYDAARANKLSIEGWQDLNQKVEEQTDSISPGLKTLISNELDFLKDHWPDNLPSGIIHADLFPDNVFFLGQKLSGLIDFYFACTDAFAYDIAICMNAWCFEAHNEFNATKARQMLSHYTASRPLNKNEYEALPILCRGAALRFLLTRVYDWLNTPENALVRPKNPDEYIAKLRFHQGIKSAAEYGLAPIT